MDYSTKMFVDFLNGIISFDKECRSKLDSAERQIRDRHNAEGQEWAQLVQKMELRTQNISNSFRSTIRDYRSQMDNQVSYKLRDNAGVFSRISKCLEVLMQIECAESNIQEHGKIETSSKLKSASDSMSVDDILTGKYSFQTTASEIISLLRQNQQKQASVKYTEFCKVCGVAKEKLNGEVESLRREINAQKESLHARYEELGSAFSKKLQSGLTDQVQEYEKTVDQFVAKRESSKAETEKTLKGISFQKVNNLTALEEAFHKEFPPQELLDKYVQIYSAEPQFGEYECVRSMPQSVHIATLRYNANSLNLSDYTKDFVLRYYPFLYRDGHLHIPFCASFGSDFNYLFRFSNEARQNMVDNACSMGMRLFSMLPPGKLKMTLVDPVKLGESFAMFTRLVDVDDRTSEIINGKIWSSPADVEDKLRILTEHISNVTQRCLQGKYANIFEYNKVAEQNAEAYHVLMLMDYPAGMTDQSLKLLEQIVASGPKCGVFTMIFWNENQYDKVPERSRQTISNISTAMQQFSCCIDGKTIKYGSATIKNEPIIWENLILPANYNQDKVIEALKKGIKSADKVVIGIEKVSKAETVNSTKDGIRIPIGLHGANEVQYLTLGVGGSHHALIAGVAGSGKSSLLHTIILRTLTQYSPEELSIYLVDFKRGVEFKIYADYALPSFKVVAIESEREFGYNILLALEREQKIRADLFKKSHVDRIEEYRELGKKMPRVLVIMDEFHELFSNANDAFAKNSATIMERIVRQGRAFGVHMILASQSYSNITGIDRAVFDQMAVRIVLKCSKADANLLLDNGSTEIDQISIDDPGRAVYNSEAGNREYNSHFRVAYVEPNKHRSMLQEISEQTKAFASQPTRILLSNIEDNKYSIFNQFENYEASRCPVYGRLYIGEPLSITNNMNMDLVRSDNSNLLLLGNDTEKARSMFAFSILSLCINYRVKHGKAPAKPFIYLLNCKPLEDSYFKDIPQIIATELLPEYVRYIHCGDEKAAHEVLAELNDDIKGSSLSEEFDKYLFVFGYQRAEELKSEIKLSQGDDIDSLFNLMVSSSSKPQLSPKEIFHLIVKDGAKHGVRAIIWQDSFSALEQDDNNIMSFFNLKVAFDMSPEEFSRSVGANDISLMSENNAIYYNKARDNQKFRPYQSPDEEWLKDISAKLH